MNNKYGIRWCNEQKRQVDKKYDKHLKHAHLGPTRFNNYEADYFQELAEAICNLRINGKVNIERIIWAWIVASNSEYCC